MDKEPDLVSHCDDELSQSSPDNFSLPHVFLLYTQSERLSRPFEINSKLHTRVDRWLENIRILGNEDFMIRRGRLLRRIRDYLSAGVEMSTLAETSNAQLFYPCLESCALHRDTEIGERGSFFGFVRYGSN
jgi:hypothetical protein